MSRHNRERRRAGVLKAQRVKILPEEHRRVNEERKAELAFYRAIRIAQRAANETGESTTVGGVAVRAYPQHWTPGWE